MEQTNDAAGPLPSPASKPGEKPDAGDGLTPYQQNIRKKAELKQQRLKEALRSNLRRRKEKTKEKD
jgi:hypothetical protein